MGIEELEANKIHNNKYHHAYAKHRDINWLKTKNHTFNIDRGGGVGGRQPKNHTFIEMQELESEDGGAGGRQPNHTLIDMVELEADTNHHNEIDPP